jgi:hypothetical protein
MAKDIEEFLRMAAARRRESQASPPAQAPRPAGQKVQRRPAPPQNLVSDDEIEVIPPRRESVAKHVEKHIDTSRLAKHASKLGEKVGRADDIMEARLHQKFETTSESAQRVPPPSGSPQALIKYMVSPQGIRQAIIVNEILNRPEWD